jgi:hypothetical protein
MTITLQNRSKKMAGMNTYLWTILEKLAAAKQHFDDRYGDHNAAMKPYDTLVTLGYATYLNTGPGDSIHEYNITDGGHAALKVHYAGEGENDG